MPHYQGVYILEGFLWARASARENLSDRLVAFSTYKRKKSLRIPYLGLLYEFVGTLEDCYDASLDFYLRLDRLGQILGRLDSLLSVEQHMLALFASARFLARSNAFELASICLGEYEALSYRLSCLKTGDILGVAGDMLQKNWFSGMTTTATDQSEPDQEAS